MPALGLGLALQARPRFGTALPPAVAAAITAVNADGWTAQWADGTPPTFTPDTTPQTIATTRAGFDAAGRTTTYAATRVFTRRKRLPYPDHAADTPSTIVLDDYVYATDVLAGAVNESTETSPKPVAAWAMPHRSVVADQLPVELVAFHRDARAGRMVAAVRFTASDGTATVSQTVAATTLSPRTGDAQPLPVYAATLDISALANGLVTVHAEVFPWIGDAASVLRSQDQSNPREFSARYFLKNPGLAAAPPYAYVAQTGSDSAGVVSTNAASAAAAPFLTVKGAIDAINSAFSSGSGVDGAVVRVGAGSFVLSSASADRVQRIAALTIERDPGVPRANAIVTWGSAVFAPRLASGLTAPLTTGCLRLRDISVQRTGYSYFQGQSSAALEIQWEDVALDNGGYNTWLTRSSNTFCGVTVANAGGGWLNATSLGEQRLVRGVVADLADGGWENWVTLASALTRPAGAALRDPTKGAIVFQNRFLNPLPTSAPLGISAVNAGETITGFWVVQNLVEVQRTGGGPAVRVSSDTVTHGNTDHCGLGHNTVTGQGAEGRHNLFYDNNLNGERRSHRRAWHKGDIISQLNCKGDVDIQDGSATGMFPYHHGVGCQGNFTQFRTNSNGLYFEFQTYPGLGSNIGTSVTVRNDPLFVNYQGVTSAAGVGGGDYRLQSGSPARFMVTTPCLSHDLAGEARRASGSDHAGAFTG
jgi:hypothetical protein